MSIVARLRAALAASRQKHPELTEEASEEVLLQILAALGGEQVVFPRTTQGKAGRPPIPSAVRSAAYEAALGADSNETIIKRHGISRSTLYRLVKRGPSNGK